MSSWALDSGLINEPISEEISISEFDVFTNQIKELPIYQDRNLVGHGMYAAALKIYSKYLEQITENQLEKDLTQILDDKTLTQTEKATLVTTRIGQGKFRKDLISHWQGCAVTGFKECRFLVASHIKPWSESEPEERLDPFNGLLLLPNLDKLFDLGFISFEDTGAICVSKELEEREMLGIEPHMKINLEQPHMAYMEYHRMQRFRP